MSALLSAVSSLVTSAVTWVGQFATALTTTGNDILLVGIAVGLVGLGVGVITRFTRMHS